MPAAAGQTPPMLSADRAVTSLAFSPDGKLLASTGGDNQIKLWDPNTHTATGMLTGQNGDKMIAVAFSPEANTLVSVGENGQILAWDLPSHTLGQSFSGQGPVTKAVFSANRQTLANLGPNGQVTLWRLVTAEGQPLAVQPVSLPSSSSSDPGGSTQQNSASNNAVQKTAAPTATAQPTAQAAAAQSSNTTAAAISNKPKPNPRNWKGITALAVGADATLAGVARAGDSKIKLYATATGSKLSSLPPIATTTFISGLAFAGTSKGLLSGSRDTIVRGWDTATGTQNRTLQGLEHPIRTIAVSPDGQFVASAGEETRIIVWNAVNGQLSRIISGGPGGHKGFINSLAFSADGTRLASAGADGRVLLWDPATGKLLKTLLGHAGEVNAVAFNKNGLLASAGVDTIIRLWDAVTGQQISRLTGYTAPVRTVAFSSDGQTLAVGGENNQILIWKTATGELLRSLTSPTNIINVLVFDPTGKTPYLLAGDEASQLSLWDVTTGTQRWSVTVSLESTQAPTLIFPADTHLSDARAVYSDSADSSAVSAVGSTLLEGLLNWLFPAANAAIPPPPGGPILVINSTSSTFGNYYAEILRNEGFNAFAVADISTVTAATLATYDVVILAPMSLTTGTGSQVEMLTNWVTAGGNLIAMRPDKNLAGLLGLADASSTLDNGYLLVDTSRAPGNGIVSQTIQFHGTADRYTLNGASSLATLYSNATTATSNPALTLRSVGTGQAAAFTYDLATSIVQTRQGNPAWAAQERDGYSPIRSDDKFYGAATGDTQPDWVDLTKVAIPQADEQQRLLANLILTMNLDKKPLPRFWYFPRGKKAVVIMTGDDHGNGGTAGRFDYFKSKDPTGCSVANWECVRGTSYIYPSTPLTKAQADAYTAAGFEVGLHIYTDCADFTPTQLEGFYNEQIQQWTAKYVGTTSSNMPS
ncbi:MAG TPA: WD40 repeat domain-containing protein, partial [Candidatus Competibacteraceae bacterium]|nr:WD40 repeat domain-containing protein [Candidatus Competibacteraceae bacterium]